MNSDLWAEQLERQMGAIGVGLNSTLPSSSGGDKVVSGDMSKQMTKYDSFSTSSRVSSSLNNSLTFPDTLSSGSNRFWTKINIYEIKYSGSQNKIYNTKGQDRGINFIKGSNGKEVVMSKTTGANTMEAGGWTSRYVLTDMTIALPYPDEPVDGAFAVRWGDDQQWGALATIFSEFMKDGALGAAKEAWDQLTKTVLSKMPKALMGGAEKRIANDRKEMLFSGVERRKFEMSWKLYPTSNGESQKLINIIEVLKNSSLPEMFGEGNVHWLSFPAMFEVCFMNGSEENTTLPRFGPCALTNLRSSAIHEDGWRGHSDGSPIGYNLGLTMEEVFPATRENLKAENDTLHLR